MRVFCAITGNVKMIMMNSRFFCLVWMMLFLTGCMDIASTGAQVVYHRQSIQSNVTDQYITYQIYRALYMDTKEFANTNISISTFNNRVLLAGEVPYAWQKEKATQIVKQIPDVEEIHNLVEVKSPSSTLTRMSDAWITTKVKSKLLASNDVDATLIKVVTENGKVYLIGTLLPEQADVAVDLARNTDGVQSVVKVFWYMKISKKLA